MKVTIIGASNFVNRMFEACGSYQWAREFLRARLAEEYDDSALPPPTETIFDLLDHIDPTPDQLARVRGDVQAA